MEMINVDKSWEEMTETEKMEELRRDSLRIMDFCNALRREHRELATDHQRLKILTNEALKEVDRLKRELGS
jgi:hypothetical protein